MIKRILLFLLILLMIISVSIAQESESKDPCEDAMTTIEMQECLDQQYQKWDAKLNLAYKEIRSKLTAARKTKLKEAQLAWIAFRDKSAEFEASEEEGGPMYSLVYISVMASLTEQRVENLREILKRMDSN
jgi:uncharacterized protein YecT (DUF1311 family)